MTLRLAHPMPRAIAGSRIFAESDVPTMIRQVSAAVADMRANFDGRIAEIEAGFNANEARRVAGALGRNSFGPSDPEYLAAFGEFVRNGRNENDIAQLNSTGHREQIRAALTIDGTDSAGGYLAPVEWDRSINQSLFDISPLRRLCDVQITTRSAYSTLWKLTGPGTGWVGETAARPSTMTPTFASIVFGHGEIYANPAASQRMLDDAEFDLARWLTGEVDTEFAKQEALAFLTGDGDNKPYGFLGYATGGIHAEVHPAGAIEVKLSGEAADIMIDSLIDFSYSLKGPYRQGSTWLMNSGTAAYLSKMKDGDGLPIWRESMIVGQPSTLLGRPVAIEENMPDLTAGSTPIAIGDFKSAYIINDRTGTRILRDPYSNKPFVSFYTTKRVGGGVKDPNAIKLLKIAAS